MAIQFTTFIPTTPLEQKDSTLSNSSTGSNLSRTSMDTGISEDDPYNGFQEPETVSHSLIQDRERVRFCMGEVKEFIKETANLFTKTITNEIFRINKILCKIEIKKSPYWTLQLNEAKDQCRLARNVVSHLARSETLQSRRYETAEDYLADLENVHSASKKILEANTVFEERFQFEEP